MKDPGLQVISKYTTIKLQEEMIILRYIGLCFSIKAIISLNLTELKSITFQFILDWNFVTESKDDLEVNDKSSVKYLNILQ